jgi:hypothetical protein
MNPRNCRWLINLIAGAMMLAALAIPGAAVERPFKLQGTTLVLGNPFDPAGAPMLGTGEATHLGLWFNEGVIFFDGRSGPPFAATAMVHFTAANGDKVEFLLVGNLDLSGVATATYYIVGGTGRFAGASGTGDFIAHPNADGTLSYTAQGIINY